MRLRLLTFTAVLALCAFAPLPSAAQTGADAPLGINETIVDFLLRVANGTEFQKTVVDQIVDGALVPIPGTVATDCAASKSGTIHPNGRFIYTTTDTGAFGSVCGYVFDPVTRTLKSMPGSPFRAGIGTRSVAIDPAGRFVYAANFDSGSVSGFEVDATTGALTPLPGSPYATGTNPRSIAVDPAGRFVYTANNTQNGALSGFVIDRATGALASAIGSPYFADQFPREIAIDPRGRYLYTGGLTNQAFAINATTGQLTKIGTGFGPSAQGMAVDPAGRYLFVTSGSGTSSLLTSFRIGADGSVSAVAPGVRTGDSPLGVAVARNGRHVYTANLVDASITGFDIEDVTGLLTPIIGSPFTASANTYALATAGWLPANASWQAGVPFMRLLGVSGGRPPYFWTTSAGILPPGLALGADLGLVSGTPTTTGTFSFSARVTDGNGAAATKNYTFTVTTGTPEFATVIEFYNQALDHYFITWRADEIALLDAGVVIKGWARTTKSFGAFIASQAGTSPICRYYIPPGLGDSHFFGRGIVECNATGARNPSFVLEDGNFMQMILPAAGVCPAGTTPVYRVFSNRADTNHRYTTERAVRDAMVAKGWLAEGDGPDLVVMCAP